MVIVAIARKELMSLIRDGRLPLLGSCLLIALVALCGAALDHWQLQQQERSRIGLTAQQQWDNQGIKNPHRGAHFGLYAFRDPSPLAAFDPGVLPHTGQAIWLEPHRRNITRFKPATDAGPGNRFAALSPAFLLYGIAPLLLLALTFNQIAGEREQGTLRMLHGIGVNGVHLILGKFISGLAAAMTLIIPLSIAVILGVMTISPHNVSTFDIFALCLLYVVYFAIVIGAGLAVASIAHDSRTALLLTLCLWILFVLIAPRAGSALAQRMVPIPSPQQFWQNIQHDYEQGLPGEPDLNTRIREFEIHLMKKYGVDSLDQVPIGVNAARRLMRDAYADRVYEIHFRALWQRYDRQTWWNRLAALLSPTVAVRSLSMLFAGTSLAHQRHFEEAAEQYRRYFNQIIDQWDMTHTKGSVSAESRHSSSDLWQLIEPFRYQPPGWQFALKRAVPDALILLAWAAGVALALRHATRRLSP